MTIVSTDRILAEAIVITLRQVGFAAVIAPALPAHSEGEDLLIVDLDTLDPTIRPPRNALTFSRFPDRGADLLRPFLLRDLTDRVLARIGRTTTSGVRPIDVPFLRLTPDGALLQGRPIALSPAEHALLALLLETPGECVPTRVIDGLWEEKGSNTTAVYIRYLRKKLDEPTGLRLIRTIRGRGYCLCLPE